MTAPFAGIHAAANAEVLARAEHARAAADRAALFLMELDHTPSDGSDAEPDRASCRPVPALGEVA